jgi:hypothetical protein
MCREKPQGGAGYEVWREKPVGYLKVCTYRYIYISGILVGSELGKDLGLGSYPDIVSLKFIDPP